MIQKEGIVVITITIIIINVIIIIIIISRRRECFRFPLSIFHELSDIVGRVVDKKFLSFPFVCTNSRNFYATRVHVRRK